MNKMDINKIIDKKLEEKRSSSSPNIVHLLNMGIDYICDNRYIPIFLPPIKISSLRKFRRSLEKQIHEHKDRELVFRSYPRKNTKLVYWPPEKDEKKVIWVPCNEYKRCDATIDLLKVEIEHWKNPQTAVISYHTSTQDEFLVEFLPRISEIMVVNETWNPHRKDSLNELNQLISDFLSRTYGFSFEDYKRNVDLSKVGGHYDKAPRYEAKIDFAHCTRFYLGTLATMAGKFHPQDSFDKIRKYRIYPTEGFDMLKFIENSLHSRSNE